MFTDLFYKKTLRLNMFNIISMNKKSGRYRKKEAASVHLFIEDDITMRFSIVEECYTTLNCFRGKMQYSQIGQLFLMKELTTFSEH